MNFFHFRVAALLRAGNPHVVARETFESRGRLFGSAYVNFFVHEEVEGNNG